METATQGCDGLGLSNSKFMTEIPAIPESQSLEKEVSETAICFVVFGRIHLVWYQLIQFTQFLKHTPSRAESDKPSLIVVRALLVGSYTGNG